MNKLTPRQKAFADHYIKTGNGTESAKKAGYKGNNLNRIASENLTKLDIKQYIEEQMTKKSSKRILRAEEALEILTSIALGEREEEVVIATDRGIQRVKKKADINQQQKAIDSLMKRFNVFASVSKIEAETELIKERTKLIKGAAKDTSLMQALIDTVNSND